MGSGADSGGVGRNALLRQLPSIDRLLLDPSVSALFDDATHERKVRVLRFAVDSARRRLQGGDARPFSGDDVRRALEEEAKGGLRPVLNATGVVLHTNLGRAPLAPEAIAAIAKVAAGYCNLEFDLHEGERGSRYDPVVPLLRALTGAEDAIVVNNGAAAVLLTLSALCAGKQAVVSRGELVEIGGGFRVPDVMRQSGAELVEVGTTNRTRLSDYAQALCPEAGLLVKVHRSNFAIVGFTEETSVAELAALGREKQVPVFEDLGSGALEALVGDAVSSERLVREAVADGADLVAFSGDKLLGGPQAGILVGRAALIAAVRRHPLNRALRIDKLNLAALEATLRLYLDGRAGSIPVRQKLELSLEKLRTRAQALSEALSAERVPHEVGAVTSQVGGGALPASAPKSVACLLRVDGPDRLLERLRRGNPAVVARIHSEQVVLDVRCLGDDELEPVARGVAMALAGDSKC